MESAKQPAAIEVGENGHAECKSLNNYPTFPEENSIYSTNSRCLGTPFVEKIENPVKTQGNELEPLALMLAAMQGGTGIDQILAVAVTRESCLGHVGRGRPAVMHAGMQRKFTLLLMLGCSRSLAAAQLGIARSTISKFMQRDKDFRLQVLEAEQLYEQMPLMTILQAAQKDWRAAAWLMRNHRPHASVSRKKRRNEARRCAMSAQDWFDATKIESERSNRGERKIQKGRS